MNCPASVRIAVEADAVELFSFLWEAHEETCRAKKDEEKVWKTIHAATSARRNPVFGIIRRARGIEAAVGLHYQTWWYSVEPVLMSFAFFVHADHRRTDHAADLRTFSAWFAGQIGMPLVMVDWSGAETGKTRLFARNGERVGSMFAQAAPAAARVVEGIAA